MDESDPATPTHSDPTPEKIVHTDSPGARALELAFARGSGDMSEVSVPSKRTEHSVMEGLPEAKAERIASIYRELAELQRQLIAAQQRVATEIQGRAEDAERFEELEARLKTHEQTTTAHDTELAGLRAQLETATATAEELRRDLATRDAQIEAALKQQADAAQRFEVHNTSLRDAKALLETYHVELATRISERDSEQAAKTKLERELEDERKQHAEAIASRDTTTTERDAIKSELEEVRRELETGRARARDVARQLQRVGQDLEGAGVLLPQPQRPQPPPPPPTPPTRAPKPEMILEVTAEPPPPSRLRSALLIAGGVILGFAATIAIVKARESSSDAAGYPTDLGASHSAAPAAAQIEPTAAPVPSEPVAKPTEPTETLPAGPPKTDTPQPAVDTTTTGVIVLPDAAAGHRVYVDGRIVEVKSSRAVVPCGARAVRIGSRGAAQTIDVACGGETAIPVAAETSDTR